MMAYGGEAAIRAVHEVIEKAREISEIVPEFIEKTQGLDEILSKLEIPLDKSKSGGLTEYQKALLKDEFNWSDEEIQSVSSWEDVEKSLESTDQNYSAIDSSDASSTEKVTTETTENTDAEKKCLTEEEKEKIKEETGWSDEIIDHIQSMEQYEEVYKNAGLHEEEINGRKCLVKDINMDYVDPKTVDDRHPNGMTNRELMESGRPPYDEKTGERIELHHMGQEYDSPFAELCENSEHGDGKDTILHDKDSDSWRNDPQLKNKYNNSDRPNHWMERAGGSNE